MDPSVAMKIHLILCLVFIVIGCKKNSQRENLNQNESSAIDDINQLPIEKNEKVYLRSIIDFHLNTMTQGIVVWTDAEIDSDEYRSREKIAKEAFSYFGFNDVCQIIDEVTKTKRFAREGSVDPQFVDGIVDEFIRLEKRYECSSLLQGEESDVFWRKFRRFLDVD